MSSSAGVKLAWEICLLLWFRRFWSFDSVSWGREFTDGLNVLKDHLSSCGLFVFSGCTDSLKTKLQPWSVSSGMVRKGEFKGGRLVVVELSGG